MIDHPITISFLDQPDSLHSLSRSFSGLEKLLNSVKRHIDPEEAPNTEFKVGDLTKNSPLCLTLGIRGNLLLGANCVRLVMATIQDINISRFVDLPSDLLEKFNLGAGVMAFNFVGETVQMATDFEARLYEMLGHEFPELTTVVGRLDTVDVHGKHVFKLFPVLGDTVKCRFSDEDFEAVKKTLGKRVEVTGVGFTRKGRAFPHRMNVEKIVELPEPYAFDFHQLRASAKDAYGGTSSVDHVRAVREQWGRSIG